MKVAVTGTQLDSHSMCLHRSGYIKRRRAQRNYAEGEKALMSL